MMTASGNADAAAIPADVEIKAKRDRVRLVRRLSKWLTKADTMARDAAKMRQDGVPEHGGWPFVYADFFALVNATRKYLSAALEGATDSKGARQ